ncbi:MAG: radical SAM protein [Bacteroidales bacterium]|nr:radical SAM protein [Bacteroidales bacterium]
MVFEYKNPLSITSQFSFCGMPFRLDTYSGCDFLCIYCFSHKRGGNSNYKNIKIADPDLIINKFRNSLEKPKINTGLISQYIRRRMPIHFGGMSDPFQNIEKKAQVSLKVLKFLCSINYPVVISTKSNLLINKEYLETLKSNPNLIIQYSFSILNDDLSKIIEPNSPTSTEKINSLKVLSKHNINTIIRWQPYIVGLSENPLEFVSKIKNSGTKHLIIEFLKLPADNNLAWETSLKPLNKVRDYYNKKNSIVIGRELILPPKEKVETIRILKNELKKYNITLGVGDNELQYLSDTECCCGVDKYKGFENWNKFQISYAIIKSINNQIKFSTIEKQWSPTGSIDKFLNSESRIEKNKDFNRVSDYIIDRWNNLSSDFNPSKYFEVEDSGLMDEKEFRIFEFRKSKTKP